MSSRLRVVVICGQTLSPVLTLGAVTAEMLTERVEFLSVTATARPEAGHELDEISEANPPICSLVRGDASLVTVPLAYSLANDAADWLAARRLGVATAVERPIAVPNS